MKASNLASFAAMGAVLLTALSAGTAVAGSPATIVQAHRGAGILAPENTMESFDLAWRMGAIPEADIRTSKDDVLVAFHDNNFKRLVKDAPPALRTNKVENLTIAELRQLDVGSWKGDQFAGQRIPRIADVFQALREHPDFRLYLDVKYVSLPRMAAMAAEQKLEQQVILSTPEYEQIREWRKILPHSPTLLWIGGTLDQQKAKLDLVRSNAFADITQLQLHVTVKPQANGDAFSPPPAMLRTVAKELKERGILFQVFTATNREEAIFRQLIESGVQSFATDEPRFVMDVLKQHSRVTQP